jgi:hypothetical protein
MTLIMVSLLIVLALAGVVTAFVAYPDRRQPLAQKVRVSDTIDRVRRRLEP